MSLVAIRSGRSQQLRLPALGHLLKETLVNRSLKISPLVCYPRGTLRRALFHFAGSQPGNGRK